MERATKLVLGLGAAGAGLAVGYRLRGRARAVAEAVLDELDLAEHSDDLEGEEVRLTSHDGGELAVHLAGDEEGPVVVLAHCWMGSRDTWAPVARRLLAEGCRVVRWDQRGHGRSVAGEKGHSIEGLADDLATVVERLALRDAVLVGHSMGGMTIQAFATHHHEAFHAATRGVVLVATAGHGLRNALNSRSPDLIKAAYVERLFERPGVGRALVRSTFGRTAHPHHLEATRAHLLATPGHVRAELATSMFAMDLREGNARIDVPTTILVGSRDTLTPVAAARSLARTIPGSDLRVLPGLGHMLPYEAPDLVAEAVLERVHAPKVVATG